jgi:hypothetical protein
LLISAQFPSFEFFYTLLLRVFSDFNRLLDIKYNALE